MLANTDLIKHTQAQSAVPKETYWTLPGSLAFIMCRLVIDLDFMQH